MTPLTKETPRATSEQPRKRYYINATSDRATSVSPFKKKVVKAAQRAPLIKPEPTDSALMPPPSSPTGSRAVVLYKGPPAQQRSKTPPRRRSITPRLPFPWRTRATPSPKSARNDRTQDSPTIGNRDRQASRTVTPTPGPSRRSRQPSTTSTRFTSPGATYGDRGRAGDSPDTAIDVDEDSDDESDDDEAVDTSTPAKGHNDQYKGKQAHDDNNVRSTAPVDSSDVTLVLEGRFLLRYECRPGSGQVSDRFVMPLSERISLPSGIDLDALKDQVDVLAEGRLERELKVKSRKMLQSAVMNAM